MADGGIINAINNRYAKKQTNKPADIFVYRKDNVVSDSEVVITITTCNDSVNGNTSNPVNLINDPGPDGISLPEAIIAVNHDNGPNTITFDPILYGMTISVTEDLPPITGGQVTINGDIDGNGTPDVTLDGLRSSAIKCFKVYASNVKICGFIIKNFYWNGIDVHTGNDGQEPKVIDKVVLQGNIISGSWGAISISNSDQNCIISNVDIIENTIENNNFTGLNIQAGEGELSTNNQIVNITVAKNKIINKGYRIAVYTCGAVGEASTNNIISGLEISNNMITGHTNSSLLICGGNSIGDQNNRIENLHISDNYIEGSPVTIEILGGAQSGAQASLPSGTSTDNCKNEVSNIIISKNTIRGGGIQFTGADGHNAAPNLALDNTIANVTIESNNILYCSANGILLQGGSFGGQNNSIKKVKIVNNLIAKNLDGGGIVFVGGYEGSTSNVIDDVRIDNNTIVENGTGKNSSWAGGINMDSNNQSVKNSLKNIKIINSIIWGNEKDIRGPNTPDSICFSLLNDLRYNNKNGNLCFQPQFINSQNNDYHLSDYSPCIGVGTSVDAPETDIEGNRRGKKPDIGAYENVRDLPLPPIIIEPPSNIIVTDIPNDDGYQLKITWEISPSESEGRVDFYRIYRSRFNKPTDPYPISRFTSLESIKLFEKYNTILIDSVTAGTTEYIDKYIPRNGVQYYYWLQTVWQNWESQKVAAEYNTIVLEVDKEFKIRNPYPNPFNSYTLIRYEIPTDCHVKLVIYDILGRKIQVLCDCRIHAGIYESIWNGKNDDGKDVSSGMYLFSLKTDNFMKQGKILLIR
ncbi:T9SS type A sorting domain-containing protein [bacterium]|nr:T9SS type A sorting domain-containing protein [bacterium]